MGLHGILGRVVTSTVMAAHHCYAICNEQRWWSDTLWATLMRLWLHSMLCYLQIVNAENFLQFHGCMVWKGTQGHGAQYRNDSSSFNFAELSWGQTCLLSGTASLSRCQVNAPRINELELMDPLAQWGPEICCPYWSCATIYLIIFCSICLILVTNLNNRGLKGVIW
jgi:hypothetical protein